MQSGLDFLGDASQNLQQQELKLDDSVRRESVASNDMIAKGGLPDDSNDIGAGTSNGNDISISKKLKKFMQNINNKLNKSRSNSTANFEE